MKACLYIVIIHTICAAKCASITIGAVVEGNETQQMQELEKEKADLYIQINDAVKNTIQTLEKSNDTDAKQGIAYLQELRTLVDHFNGTEVANKICNGSLECIANQASTTTNASNVFKDGRRQAGGMKKTKHKNMGHDHVKQAIIKMGMFKTEDQLTKIREAKVKNLLALQGKLDNWLKIRQAEKKKIKMYQARLVSNRQDYVTEECPPFGETRKKRKKKGEARVLQKYPCCRKCCKKSYMGCL